MSSQPFEALLNAYLDGEEFSAEVLSDYLLERGYEEVVANENQGERIDCLLGLMTPTAAQEVVDDIVRQATHGLNKGLDLNSDDIFPMLDTPGLPGGMLRLFTRILTMPFSSTRTLGKLLPEMVAKESTPAASAATARRLGAFLSFCAAKGERNFATCTNDQIEFQCQRLRQEFADFRLK